MAREERMRGGRRGRISVREWERKAGGSVSRMERSKDGIE